ncbi:hypothetical protein DP116_17035 [Brasilonema bromeliae SPC951]|uniref:Uncharacterized protein n=1 Tax=Brasilonema bromeliae SPC951 TaxID=385972 RepID=A0ABX1PAS5_9CYAN|nr:hypothetical protein [Brasilonema bromeliae SPC951]
MLGGIALFFVLAFVVLVNKNLYVGIVRVSVGFRYRSTQPTKDILISVFYTIISFNVVNLLKQQAGE